MNRLSNTALRALVKNDRIFYSIVLASVSLEKPFDMQVSSPVEKVDTIFQVIMPAEKKSNPFQALSAS